MLKTPTSDRDLRSLSAKKSFDTRTQQSVRSNSRFFKAVKQKSYKDMHLSLPISAIQKVDSSNMPLNQIPFRLTQHAAILSNTPYDAQVPFAISASEHAFYQELETKERERYKKEKVDDFLMKTRARVEKVTKMQDSDKAYIVKKIEDHIRDILTKAIEFSMKTNMIKKSGTNVNHEDVEHLPPGPPTFNEQNSHRNNDGYQTTEKPVKIDLSELKVALESGATTQKVMNIVDKIIEARDTIEDLNQPDPSEKHTRMGTLSPEELKRNETPDFDFTKLNTPQNMYGIPPRDFQAFVPLLKLLKLENYDKSDFLKFHGK